MIRTPFQPLARHVLRRRIGQVAGIAIIAVLLASASALGDAGEVLAAESTPAIDQTVTAIEIHAVSQPDDILPSATGTPQSTAGLSPIVGAEFTAKRVPGIDLLTNAGQRQAGALSVDDALALTLTAPVEARGTTDTTGNVRLAPLSVGLYVVEETRTPAGFVSSVPFVVALPLTDPERRDRFLTTVHVYPKNAEAGASLRVDDQDAVALGDEVTWTSTTTIPVAAPLDGYRVVQQLDSRLVLSESTRPATVSVECATSRAGVACPVLREGVHYTQIYNVSSHALTVDFTPAGLAVLRAAVAENPQVTVAVAYRTAVVADGEIQSKVLLYPSAASIAGAPGAPAPSTATAQTKWGPLAVVVRERDDPSRLIAGTVLRVFATADDARTGKNPITVGGVSEWTTDSAGHALVPGLRFSGFVNGFDRASGDPLYRYYYVVPTAFPSGYVGSVEPIRTVVVSSTDATTVVVPVWRTIEPPAPGVSLPVTGGQLAGGVLIAGLGLIGVGVFFVARRRRHRGDESRRTLS